MKIIQSFWVKPSEKKADFHSDDRSKGGWLSSKWHLMSWALSCHLALRYYERVELYTDSAGKALLIDMLNLPYTKVVVCLDELHDYPEDLWTFGKIKAYGLQDEPFIHIDSDVFFWEPFKQKNENTIVAQNLEYNIDFYFKNISHMLDHFELPLWFRNSLDRQEIFSANTGVVGGGNWRFYKEYSELCFDIMRKNSEKLEGINISQMAITIEQVVFFVLSKERNVEVNYLFDEVCEGNYYFLTKFHEVPVKTTFIHAIGSNNKKSHYILDQIDTRLRMEFPDYYYEFSSIMKLMGC